MPTILGKIRSVINFQFSINKVHDFMSLDRTAVEQIARLARLSVDAEESAGYQQELGQILELVNQLETAATANVTPLAHPLDLSARLRPDEVTETDQRGRFQSQAPAVEDGYYLVPKVID